MIANWLKLSVRSPAHCRPAVELAPLAEPANEMNSGDLRARQMLSTCAGRAPNLPTGKLPQAGAGYNWPRGLLAASAERQTRDRARPAGRRAQVAPAEGAQLICAHFARTPGLPSLCLLARLRRKLSGPIERAAQLDHF